MTTFSSDDADDLVEEWYSAGIGDEAYDYPFKEFIIYRTGWSNEQFNQWANYA